MMKDVTKEFFKQPRDYGKKANLNLTRVDIYAAKLKNIYRILGKDTVLLKIRFGKTVTRQFQANLPTALDELRNYGKIYFLDVSYANTKDSITIKLNGLVPGGLEKARKEAAS